MKYVLLFLLMLSSQNKSLRTEGFLLEWNHQGDYVWFSLTAPTEGWLAVGFNDADDLMGSNLIQGGVIQDKVVIQDQFITGFGEHPPVETLAVPSRISGLAGSQMNGSTTISFYITKDKMDKLHYDLSEGREINVWLAYSISDHFQHHSRKRILRRIEL